MRFNALFVSADGFNHRILWQLEQSPVGLILVNGLQQTWPQVTMDLNRRADDLFCKRVPVLHRVILFGSHRGLRDLLCALDVLCGNSDLGATHF